MFSPQQSFLDRYADHIEIAAFDTREELKARRLAGLLREVEPMNLRIKALEQYRLRHTGVSPPPQTLLPEVSIEPAHVERKPMSVLGLQGGAISAAIEKAKERLAAKHAEGLAKIDSATSSAAAKIDGVTTQLASKIEKEIEEQVSEFVQLTNGGPV